MNLSNFLYFKSLVLAHWFASLSLKHAFLPCLYFPHIFFSLWAGAGFRCARLAYQRIFSTSTGCSTCLGLRLWPGQGTETETETENRLVVLLVLWQLVCLFLHVMRLFVLPFLPLSISAFSFCCSRSTLISWGFSCFYFPFSCLHTLHM